MEPRFYQGNETFPRIFPSYVLTVSLGSFSRVLAFIFLKKFEIHLTLIIKIKVT